MPKFFGGGGGTPAPPLTASSPLSIIANVISVANLSNVSKGVVTAITGANLPLVSDGSGVSASWQQMSLNAIAQSGAVVNQYPSWSGSAWVPATPLPAPANPSDDSKLAIASGGSFTYSFLSDVNVSSTAAIAGSKIAPQFGAQVLSITGAGTLQIGTNPATTGIIRLAHTTTIFGRNSLNSQNQNLIDWGSSTVDTLTVGNNGTAVSIVSNPVVVTAGGVSTVFTSTSITVTQPVVQFANSANGIIRIASISTAGATGLLLSIRGQIMTGTGATVGGNIAIVAGSGATAGVTQIFKSDATTQLLKCDDTGVRLYTGSTVAQASRVGQFTNSTGIGSFSLVISDVTTTGLADPVKCNQNFANMLTWGNALELAIHNIGLTA